MAHLGVFFISDCLLVVSHFLCFIIVCEFDLFLCDDALYKLVGYTPASKRFVFARRKIVVDPG